MMGGALRSICILSVVSGLLGTVSDRNVKRISELLSACILILCILKPLSGIDTASAFPELSGFSEREAELREKADEERERMNRSVIEEKYGAYIMDKAKELAVSVTGARVSAERNAEGIWMPFEAYILYEGDEAGRGKLAETIRVNLGIPEERQIWSR